jgi:DNA invertase Pin-like site-specific DNA recombinase
MGVKWGARGDAPVVRVASLLRLSSKKQVARQGGDDQDIPGQRESIARFLETKSDWKLVKEYVEAAVSAYKKGRSERDKLMDAIRDAEDGKYDVLVVWKGDRLSRRIEDFPGIVKDLTEEIGVEVWSVADELGGKRWSARNALEMLMLSIEGFKNQSESENISVRTREKKRQMREAGQWTGGHVPFGYQLIVRRTLRESL